MQLPTVTLPSGDYSKHLAVAGIVIAVMAMDFFKINDPTLKTFLMSLGGSITLFGGYQSVKGVPPVSQ